MVAEGGFASLRERAQAAARARVEAALEGLEAYHATRAQELARELPGQCTEDLQALSPDFKFIVSCAILPKSGNFGLHASNACVWDAERDGSCTVQWENSAVFCLVNIFAVSLE
mmetsp:Transcript_10393/g.33183  ORF Transcript_10393/g.33183 Transcript_10393/m.33183 type:complete len:114 (-) Transcript_10393:961-1302(-)